jgi:hypothetical protein
MKNKLERGKINAKKRDLMLQIPHANNLEGDEKQLHG